MFAIEHEEVVPDIMVLAKSLSGGYLPIAITLVSEKIFHFSMGRLPTVKRLHTGIAIPETRLDALRPKPASRFLKTSGSWKLYSPKSGI